MPSSAAATIERRRAGERLQVDEPLHTRSTVVARAKSPSGRTSSTRITAAKMNVGRYWLWLVGSAPPRSPVAKPIEKPPSVAGIGPVHARRATTPASTTIVSRSAKSGVTSGFCTVSITATTAASAPERSTAHRDHAVGAHAEHARRLEVHRRGAHVQADRRSLEQQLQQRRGRRGDDDRDDRDLADVDAGDRPRLVEVRERRRDLPERAEPEQRDALEQERDRERRDEHHRGRVPAQRPEDEPVHQRPTARARPRSRGRSPAQTGQPHCEASASANAPAITSWP